MSETSNAATPAPDAGSNSQPNLSIVPEPKKRRVPRRPFALTNGQQAEVELTLDLCVEGLKPAHAGKLETNTVSGAFLTALRDDAKAVQEVGRAAVNATSSKEGCTADEATARAALLENLRKIQSAARAAYGDAQPERVNNYLVGNDIAANRKTLQSSANTIIGQATADHPADVDTQFILDTTGKSELYVSSKGSQKADISAARQQRVARNGLIDSIRARRMKLQRAADSAWPYTNPANAGVRRLFRLPANRPYSY